MRLARTIRVVEGAKCSFSKLQDGLIDPSSVQHRGTVMGSFSVSTSFACNCSRILQDFY